MVIERSAVPQLVVTLGHHRTITVTNILWAVFPVEGRLNLISRRKGVAMPAPYEYKPLTLLMFKSVPGAVKALLVWFTTVLA